MIGVGANVGVGTGVFVGRGVLVRVGAGVVVGGVGGGVEVGNDAAAGMTGVWVGVGVGSGVSAHAPVMATSSISIATYLNCKLTYPQTRETPELQLEVSEKGWRESTHFHLRRRPRSFLTRRPVTYGSTPRSGID